MTRKEKNKNNNNKVNKKLLKKQMIIIKRVMILLNLIKWINKIMSLNLQAKIFKKLKQNKMKTRKAFIRKTMIKNNWIFITNRIGNQNKFKNLNKPKIGKKAQKIKNRFISKRQKKVYKRKLAKRNIAKRNKRKRKPNLKQNLLNSKNKAKTMIRVN